MVGVTVGLIALVCDAILRTMQWSGSSGSSRKDDDKGGGSGAAALLVILLVVVAILAPITCGNTFGSHGPQANTNCRACRVAPERVTTEAR